MITKRTKMNKPRKMPSVTIAECDKIPRFSWTSRMLFDYADALREIGRLSEALLAYDELKSYPIPEEKRWLLPLFRGQTLLEAGQHSLAEQSFREALILNPSTTVASVFLASTFTVQEKFDSAIETLRHALYLKGDIDEVLVNLGINLRAKGKLDDALKYVKEALKISPTYPEALELLEDIQSALSARKT